MKRARSVFFLTAAGVLLAGVRVQGQAANPRFEVATIKPTIPDKPGGYALNCKSGGGFVAMEQTLESLVEWAYDLPHSAGRVVGGPNWMHSAETRFAVHGKVERKVSLEECRLMVRALLAERFQVATHWETRELPVYLLTIGKKGSKLRRTDEDPEVLSSVTLNGGQIQLGDGYRTGMGRGMSMRELARYLTSLPVVQRPVIDKTGLEGFYGFSLDFAMTLGDNSRPDIFSALQEQLGLRLDPAKGPVELLVVDRAQKPSEN